MSSRDAKRNQHPSTSTSPPTSSWPIRALTGLPILIFLLTAIFTMLPALDAIPSGNGYGSPLILTPDLHVPIQLRYSGWRPLDEFIAMYAMVFTGSIGGFDALGRLQMVGFLADLVGVVVVMGVESGRGGSRGWMVTGVLPTLIISLMYQIQTIAFLGPIYFYVHYIQCPLSRYATSESRATRLSTAKAILPTVLITYIIPGIAMFTVPDLETRQWINGAIWQPFPIYAAILQPLLVFVLDVSGPNKSSSQSTKAPISNKEEADVPILRYTYLFAAGVSSLAYLYIHLTSSASLIDIFLANLSEPSAVVTLMEGSSKALRYDYLCCFGGTFTWVLLSYRDLKAARLVEWSWVRIVVGMLVMVVTVGPGAMLAVMWYFRELALVKGVRGGSMGVDAGKRK